MIKKTLTNFNNPFNLVSGLGLLSASLGKNLVRKCLIFFSASIMIIFASACQGKKNERVSNKAQPSLDSTYYINYVKSEPKFKDQLDWVKSFYREREFQLGWFKNNKIVPEAEKMLSMITKANEEGLYPQNYQIKDFTKLFADLEDSKRDSAKYTELQKEIDVSLSATYFVWASDYYRGVVIPKENEEIEWDVKRNKIKLHKALMTVLGERESKYSYASFSPLHPEYSRLKTALVSYRKIQASGGWPKITASPKLRAGEASPVIPALRKRLGLSGGTDSVYTAEVFNAVKQFQNDLGLQPDGALGNETVRIMNIPVEQRVKQIILNMERWRWIPKSFEPDYLLVNIPEYKLHVFEKSKHKMSMNVIVGKTLNSTPIFSDKMETVVLSPYWNVPVSIIVKELAPKIAGNPSYLDRTGYGSCKHKGRAGKSIFYQLGICKCK
jgi:murein L,D-transpeptidase YcbB/YkuD